MDPDTDDGQLVYEITTEPKHGFLESKLKPGSPITTFTQGTQHPALCFWQQIHVNIMHREICSSVYVHFLTKELCATIFMWEKWLLVMSLSVSQFLLHVVLTDWLGASFCRHSLAVVSRTFGLWSQAICILSFITDSGRFPSNGACPGDVFGF